jgi:hypothetical protein
MDDRSERGKTTKMAAEAESAARETLYFWNANLSKNGTSATPAQ